MSGNHDHGFAHPAPPSLLLGTFFALIVLTVVTVVTAGNPLLGPFGVWIAMGIASLKAALVALFFMHMYWDKPFNVISFLSAFIFAALFVGMTLMDTGEYQNSIDKYPRAPRAVTPAAQ